MLSPHFLPAAPLIKGGGGGISRWFLPELSSNPGEKKRRNMVILERKLWIYILPLVGKEEVRWELLPSSSALSLPCGPSHSFRHGEWDSSYQMPRVRCFTCSFSDQAEPRETMGSVAYTHPLLELCPVLNQAPTYDKVLDLFPSTTGMCC